MSSLEIKGGNFLYIYKGFKILGAAIVPALIFAQSAAAAPSTVYYQDATTQTMVSASYTDAMFQKSIMHNANMFNALNNAFLSAENNNTPLLITDGAKTIDWAAAYAKNENYTNALSDASVVAAAPTVDATMDINGTPIVTAASTAISSVSVTNPTTVTATLTPAPTVAPVAGDFVVLQTINGATTTTLTPTLVMNGAVATFTVPPVAPTDADQSVMYTISYKGGASVSKVTTVAANSATAIAGVNAATAVTMQTVLETNAAALTLDLTDYNTLAASNKAAVATAVLNGRAIQAGASYPDAATIKAAFDNSVVSTKSAACYSFSYKINK